MSGRKVEIKTEVDGVSLEVIVTAASEGDPLLIRQFMKEITDSIEKALAKIEDT